MAKSSDMLNRLMFGLAGVFVLLVGLFMFTTESVLLVTLPVIGAAIDLVGYPMAILVLVIGAYMLVYKAVLNK